MITPTEPKLTDFATAGSTSVARRVPRKFAFTKKKIDALEAPTNDQRAYYYDSQSRGLAVAVSPAGKKVFILYRKVERRPERITIGPYPDLTIDQARRRADELNGAIANGQNPAEKRRIERGEMTLGELFNTYLELHAKPHVKGWPDLANIFTNHLGSLARRRLSE